MLEGRGRFAAIVVVMMLGTALAACTHSGTSSPGPVAANNVALPTVAAPAPPAGPMTREKASTDCWMRYEGRGLSLDQRLPLVEKCTAEKMQAGGS